jgi:hypothetical protein
LEEGHILTHGVLLLSILPHDNFQALLIIDHLCLATRNVC